MKREFLEGLGLEKDVIDKIMDENGKDINREKTKADEYKTQLDSAKETLKSFEGVDVNELNGKITQLTADLAQSEKDHAAKLADMEFQSTLDAVLSGSKAKNVKAVKALLDIEALRASKNQSEDIKTAVEKVKTENDFLFESDEPIKNPVAPTNNPQLGGITAEAFAKMGYRERLNLKRTDPKKYNELKGD